MKLLLSGSVLCQRRLCTPLPAGQLAGGDVPTPELAPALAGQLATEGRLPKAVIDCAVCFAHPLLQRLAGTQGRKMAPARAAAHSA